MKSIANILCILYVLAAAGCKGQGVTPGKLSATPKENDTAFVKGADISWLTQMEAAGYHFYDSSGTQKDCLQILKEKGINTIRLRVWVHPKDGWCNTADVLTKAIRTHQLGFRLMIDFHYSDVWADPGHQTKPAAWANADLNGLVDSIYQHTFNVLTVLKSNGIIPQWVQVGNETNNGMLWPDGMASVHMDNFAKMINAGYQAAKGVDSSIQVIVHISNGYDNSLFRWVFDGLRANGAQWDITGMSLYPGTTNWQSMDSACLFNMQDMISRYGKAVMICETGMDVNAPSACRAFLSDIISKVRSIPENKGLGVLYWEPESYNWQGYLLGAFDNNGRPTAALDAFEQ